MADPKQYTDAARMMLDDLIEEFGPAAAVEMIGAMKAKRDAWRALFDARRDLVKYTEVPR